MQNLTQRSKIFVLLGMFVATLVAAAFVAPIPQDPNYHIFADSRPLLGVANFGDVLSNVGFAVVGIIGLFTGVKASVLQNQNLAVSHCGDRICRRGAQAVFGKGDRRADLFGQFLGHGAQAVGRIALALGSPEMGEQNDFRAFTFEVFDCRQGGPNACRIGNPAIRHRDIEIDTDQDPLAVHICIFNATKFGHQIVSRVNRF